MATESTWKRLSVFYEEDPDIRVNHRQPPMILITRISRISKITRDLHVDVPHTATVCPALVVLSSLDLRSAILHVHQMTPTPHR